MILCLHMSAKALGQTSAHLGSGTTLASRHTAPATTGDATDVPDRLRQPPWIRLPSTSRPYATTSGCAGGQKAHRQGIHHGYHSALHSEGRPTQGVHLAAPWLCGSFHAA